jgi:hypothetical protein
MKKRDRIQVGAVCLVAAGLLGPGKAEARAPAPTAPAPTAETQPLGPLSWLAGNCYTGTFTDGETRDLICYEWVFEGKFLRSRHRVVGGPAPYAGETIFSFDQPSGAIRFDYFNSDGDVMRGTVTPTEDGFEFPIEATIGGGKSQLRSVWKRRGEDGYSASTEQRSGEEWKPLFTTEFVRDRTPSHAGADALAPVGWPAVAEPVTPAPPPAH